MATLYFLECHSAARHRIDIPAPTLLAKGSNLATLTTVEKRAVFVCNQCAIVSLYSSKEIRWEESHTPDPFQSRAYSLNCLQAECDARSCALPKIIHVVFHVAGEPYPTNAASWWNDGTAKCDGGHLIEWNPQTGLVAVDSESPF